MTRMQPHPPAALPPHCGSNLPAKKTVNVLAALQQAVLGWRRWRTADTSIRRADAGHGCERVFERKVRLSKWALLFEQLWPRAWLVLGLAGLFIGASLAGLWPRLPELPHKIVLALFALAFVVALVALDPGALAVARAGHPPRRGGVRHQASPRVLL